MNTPFNTGSVTKLFTLASSAMLVDEGKIRRDDKVMKYLMGLRLFDLYVMCKLTVQDLLCHRIRQVWFN